MPAHSAQEAIESPHVAERDMFAKYFFLATGCLLLGAISVAEARAPNATRLQAEAQAVTITRDDWGIAHVHGKTDADAVFGMIYAQAEDDFNRVETNYLTALGRTAEAEGEVGDLGRPAAEAVHRSGRAEDPVRAKSRMAASADGCLGRRPELLPGHAPGCASERDRAFRAVDGAELHRRQHRRRHRARVDCKQLAAFYGDDSVPLSRCRRYIRAGSSRPAPTASRSHRN